MLCEQFQCPDRWAKVLQPELLDEVREKHAFESAERRGHFFQHRELLRIFEGQKPMQHRAESTHPLFELEG
jgi:hypothetical protein